MWMEEEKMVKKAHLLRKQGRRKIERPRLRWECCVRMDIKKVEMVGEWRELAEDREGSGGVLRSMQGRSLLLMDLIHVTAARSWHACMRPSVNNCPLIATTN